MLKKIEHNLKFSNKRNYKIITPCCNRSNTDGKFVNYINVSENYGYCHSCGKVTLPPAHYKDESGNDFFFNEIKNNFESTAMSVAITGIKNVAIPVVIPKIPQIFIPEEIIWQHYYHEPENNLLQYLRKTYGNERTDNVKELYSIGTSKDGGTIFWNINKDLKVQKSKICYYTLNGKRTNKFKVPFTNEKGYFSCLFGEHLLSYKHNQNKTIILVESEKTAIIGTILLSEYVWIAYGGINGLKIEKTQPLKGFRVLIVPDVSENAVAIIHNRLHELIAMGINAHIWDMSNGKNDKQLKNEGIYNSDLEDVFRSLIDRLPCNIL